MVKVLHKIMLLVAVTTVIGHSILPHIHHDEIAFREDRHHHDSNTKHHHEDKNESDEHHDLLSFAQLDENYIPAKKLYSNFEVRVEFIPILTLISIDNSRVVIKSDFSWYKEYPPPNDHFFTPSFRGPPVA